MGLLPVTGWVPTRAAAGGGHGPLRGRTWGSPDRQRVRIGGGHRQVHSIWGKEGGGQSHMRGLGWEGGRGRGPGERVLRTTRGRVHGGAQGQEPRPVGVLEEGGVHLVGQSRSPGPEGRSLREGQGPEAPWRTSRPHPCSWHRALTTPGTKSFPGSNLRSCSTAGRVWAWGPPASCSALT